MTQFQQMDLFSKTPQSKPDDDHIAQLERGHAFLYNQDFPDDYKLFFDVEFIAYETDIETGNENVANTMKQTQFMTFSELQKYVLQITDKWSKSYDHIAVDAKLQWFRILEYFGD